MKKHPDVESPMEDAMEPMDAETAEMDLKHLKHVHEMMGDQKRMAHVQQLAGRHMKAVTSILKATNNKKPKINSVEDLNAAYKSKFGGHRRSSKEDSGAE